MPTPPRKILFVSHVPQIGGAEASLLDLIQALDTTRFAASVALSGPGPLAAALAARGIPTFFLPLRRLRRTLNPLRLSTQAWSVWRAAPAVARVLRDGCFDLVHGNSDTAFLYAALAARRAAVPAVWHCRDLSIRGPLGTWMCDRAARIVAISEAVRAHLCRYTAVESRLITIHNGIDVERFTAVGERAKTRAALGVGAETLLIGMVAQMVPWKNHALFFDMARDVGSALPDARFLVVGGDTFGDKVAYTRELERRAHSPELTGRVILAGAKPDVRPFYEAMDMLVHPAAREPFGRVVAEAMAMGKPVVAINACGPAEIIRDGTDGLLVPADSAKALAAAVLRLAHDAPLRVRLGTAAAARIREAFSLRLLGVRVAALYADLLEGPSGAPE